MKKIIFKGGLGNQLFQYAFYKYIVTHLDGKAKAVLRKGNNHGGLQILDYFDVKIELLTGLALLYYRVREFLSMKGLWHLEFANEDNYLDSNSDYIADYYQNSNYIYTDFVKFKKMNLDPLNNKILNEILSTNSVSVHVRRGDYLLPQYSKIYGNICTPEYYNKAIEICRQYSDDLNFFIFSDDITWSKNNLLIKNAKYINWNTGDKAPIDMYLMSNCKMNIIANSTFSFWGAYLNKRSSLVVYPKKWFNSLYSAPDIFPDDWVGLE